MDAWGAAVVSLLITLSAPCTRPVRARCPDGHDLRTGIRRSGAFECWPVPGGDPLYDGAGGFPERSTQSTAILRGQIYCTGGAHPIVVDFRTVGCQR